jgi:hypothetical protein
MGQGEKGRAHGVLKEGEKIRGWEGGKKWGFGMRKLEKMSKAHGASCIAE